MSYRRQTIGGFLFMGKARIPPLPQNIVMKDRMTGTEYFLTHTGEEGTLAIELSETLPTKPDTRHYAPYEGPYLRGNVRLYISNGTLAAELVHPADYEIQNQRVLTRRGNERTYIELTANADGDIVYTETDE